MKSCSAFAVRFFKMFCSLPNVVVVMVAWLLLVRLVNGLWWAWAKLATNNLFLASPKDEKCLQEFFGEEIGNVFRVRRRKNPNHHHWNVLEIRTTRKEKKVLKHLSGFSHSLAASSRVYGGKVDSRGPNIFLSLRLALLLPVRDCQNYTCLQQM